MKQYYPYDLSKPVQIIGEEHKISNDQIVLDHIPLLDSLEIVGFVPHDNTVDLPANGFYINYRADTFYRECDRVVRFYTGQNGLTVTCSYKAVGSPVTAEDMNEIREHMEAEKDQSSATVLVRMQNDIVQMGLQADNRLQAHENSYDAHQPIWSKIELFETTNAREHSALKASLDEHKSSSLAHQDIRAEIDSLDSDLQGYKLIVEDEFTEHNTSSLAHADIRSSISTWANDFKVSLSSEISARSSMDSSLASSISGLRSDLSTEKSQRSSMDNALANSISGLANDFKVSLSSESSSRSSMDNSLASSISNWANDFKVSLSNHNSSSLAHADIRNSISGLREEFSNISSGDFEVSLSAHNSSSLAHSDIRESITALENDFEVSLSSALVVEDPDLLASLTSAFARIRALESSMTDAQFRLIELEDEVDGLGYSIDSLIGGD